MNDNVRIDGYFLLLGECESAAQHHHLLLRTLIAIVLAINIPAFKLLRKVSGKRAGDRSFVCVIKQQLPVFCHKCIQRSYQRLVNVCIVILIDIHNLCAKPQYQIGQTAPLDMMDRQPSLLPGACRNTGAAARPAGRPRNGLRGAYAPARESDTRSPPSDRARSSGHSPTACSPRRYRCSSSWDRRASIRRTSRRWPFTRGTCIVS